MDRTALEEQSAKTLGIGNGAEDERVATRDREPQFGAVSGPMRATYDSEGFTEDEERRQKLRAEAATRVLFDTDLTKCDDAMAGALFRSVTRNIFGIEDTDGDLCFKGRKSADMKKNVEMLRDALSGKNAKPLYDPQYEEYLKADRARRLEMAGESEHWWEAFGRKLPGWMGVALKCLPQSSALGVKYDNSLKVGETSDERAARLKNDEDKLLASYEEKMAKNQPLITLLSYQDALTDRAGWILAKSVADGRLDANEVATIPDKEQRERVMAGFGAVMGDAKKASILGFDADVSTGTWGDSFQRKLSGLWEGVSSLFTDVYDMEGDFGSWLYLKSISDLQERERVSEMLSLNRSIETANKRPLPKGGFTDQALQTLAENAHWFIPYGWAKLAKTRAGVMAKGGRTLFGKKNIAGAEAAKAAKETLELEKGVAISHMSGDVKYVKTANGTIVEQLVDNPTAAVMPELAGVVNRYDQALAKIGDIERKLGVTKGMYEAQMVAARAMTFSAFAEEFITACDLQGVGREWSIPTSIAVGLVNDRIEQIEVPFLSEDIKRKDLRSISLRALQHHLHQHQLGVYLKKRLSITVPAGIKVALSEGAVEEPLQQLVIEHFKVAAEDLNGLTDKDGKELSQELKDLVAHQLEMAFNGQDLRTYAETLGEMIPAMAGYIGTTGGREQARYAAGRAWNRTFDKKHFVENEGFADVLSRNRHLTSVIAKWNNGEDVSQEAEKAKAQGEEKEEPEVFIDENGVKHERIQSEEAKAEGEEDAEDKGEASEDGEGVENIVEAEERSRRESVDQVEDLVRQAREIYDGSASNGDAVTRLMDEMHMPQRLAEIAADTFADEDLEIASGNAQVKAFKKAYTGATLEEGDFEALGAVKGSVRHDRARGLTMVTFNINTNGKTLPGVKNGTFTLVYREGATLFMDESGNFSRKKFDAQLADNSDFGVSYDETNPDHPWATLSILERKRCLIQLGKGVHDQSGSITFKDDATGEEVSVPADAVINLANGKIRDIAYQVLGEEEAEKLGRGEIATGWTMYHETWHHLWKLASMMLSDEEKIALAKEMDVDMSDPQWQKVLDERMAIEFEQWGAGQYVRPKAVTRFEKIQSWAAGLLEKLPWARPLEQKNMTTGESFKLADFYQAVLDGKLGSPDMRIPRKAKAEGKGESAETGDKGTVSKGELPVAVTDEDRKSAEKKDEGAAVEETKDEGEAPKDGGEGAGGGATPTRKVAENDWDFGDHVVMENPKRPGLKFHGKVKVMDLRKALNSFMSGVVNPYQNRDENTQDAAAAVAKMVPSVNFNFAGLLGPAFGGSTLVVDKDGYVVVGNHRVRAVQLAAQANNEAWKKYRQRVLAEADARGLEIDDEALEYPLLVVELVEIEGGEGLSMNDIGKESNVQQTRGSNVYEQATDDAEAMAKLGTIDKIETRTDGSIDTTKQDTIDALTVFKDAVGADGFWEEETVGDGLGQATVVRLSEDGARRVGNAVLALLLGGDKSVRPIMKEWADEKRLDIKNEKAALMKVAADILKLAGERETYDIRENLKNALTVYAAWREADEAARAKKGVSEAQWAKKKGYPFETFVAQQDLFKTRDIPGEMIARRLAESRQQRSFAANGDETAAGQERAIKYIVEWFAKFAERARKVNVETDDMFGTPPASKEEILGMAFSVAAAPTIKLDRQFFDDAVGTYGTTEKAGEAQAVLPDGRILKGKAVMALGRIPVFGHTFLLDDIKKRLPRKIEGAAALADDAAMAAYVEQERLGDLAAREALAKSHVVRVTYGGQGLQFFGLPTEQQEAALWDLVADAQGGLEEDETLMVDFSDEWGTTPFSKQYSAKASPRAVIDDAKGWYGRKEKPLGTTSGMSFSVTRKRWKDVRGDKHMSLGRELRPQRGHSFNWVKDVSLVPNDIYDEMQDGINAGTHLIPMPGGFKPNLSYTLNPNNRVEVGEGSYNNRKAIPAFISFGGKSYSQAIHMTYVGKTRIVPSIPVDKLIAENAQTLEAMADAVKKSGAGRIEAFGSHPELDMATATYVSERSGIPMSGNGPVALVGFSGAANDATVERFKRAVMNGQHIAAIQTISHEGPIGYTRFSPNDLVSTKDGVKLDATRGDDAHRVLRLLARHANAMWRVDDLEKLPGYDAALELLERMPRKKIGGMTPDGIMRQLRMYEATSPFYDAITNERHRTGTSVVSMVGNRLPFWALGVDKIVNCGELASIDDGVEHAFYEDELTPIMMTNMRYAMTHSYVDVQAKNAAEEVVTKHVLDLIEQIESRIEKAPGGRIAVILPTEDHSEASAADEALARYVLAILKYDGYGDIIVYHLAHYSKSRSDTPVFDERKLSGFEDCQCVVISFDAGDGTIVAEAANALRRANPNPSRGRIVIASMAANEGGLIGGMGHLSGGENFGKLHGKQNREIDHGESKTSVHRISRPEGSSSVEKGSVLRRVYGQSQNGEAVGRGVRPDGGGSGSFAREASQGGVSIGISFDELSISDQNKALGYDQSKATRAENKQLARLQLLYDVQRDGSGVSEPVREEREGILVSGLAEGTGAQGRVSRVGGETHIILPPRGEQKRGDTIYPDAGAEIRDTEFSVGAKRKDEYRALMERKRPDLDFDDREDILEELDGYNNPKKEKLAMHWIICGTVRLPEDEYKIDKAIKTAERAKVDPFLYQDPEYLFEVYRDFVPADPPIDPDTVPELQNRTEVADGIVVYDVDETLVFSKEAQAQIDASIDPAMAEAYRMSAIEHGEARPAGQIAMRKILNSHWGADASPWCLLQGDNEGYLTDSALHYWNHYSALTKRVAFKDGKLLAFMATDADISRLIDDEINQRVYREETGHYAYYTDGEFTEAYKAWLAGEQWWDRMDSSHDGIPLEGRLPNDPLGRSGTFEYDSHTKKRTLVGKLTRGNDENGVEEAWADEDTLLYRMRRSDGNTVNSITWYNDGKVHGIFTQDKMASWYSDGSIESITINDTSTGRSHRYDYSYDGVPTRIARYSKTSGITVNEVEVELRNGEIDRFISHANNLNVNAFFLNQISNNGAHVPRERMWVDTDGNIVSVRYNDDGRFMIALVEDKNRIRRLKFEAFDFEERHHMRFNTLAEYADWDRTQNGDALQLTNLAKQLEKFEADVREIAETYKRSAEMHKVARPNIPAVPGLSDDALQFSVAAVGATASAVGRRKDLVALHNIKMGELRSVLRLGGFAMPSVAVTKDTLPHEHYGEITIIFKPGAIDPKASRYNKVYSGDAWTPTFPEVDAEIDDEVMARVNKTLSELLKKGGVDDLFSNGWYNFEQDDGIAHTIYGYDNPADGYARDELVKAAYLIDKGETIELIKKPDGAVDRWETKDAIRTRVDHDSAEYLTWVRNLFNGFVAGYGLRNEKGLYTRSGNRRSWKALHDAITLDNAVRIMRHESAQASDGYNHTSFEGAAARSLASLDEVIGREGQLRDVPEDEYKATKRDLQDHFLLLVHEYRDAADSVDDNPLVALDRASDMMLDTYLERKGSAMAMLPALNTYGYHADEDFVRRFLDLMREAGHMPTRYFEAKPMRAVYFNDVAAAIVPEATPDDVLRGLKDNGVRVYTYHSAEEASDRTEVTQKAADDTHSAFSVAPIRNGANPTLYPRAVVKTVAFKKWFGDWENDPANASKVVDANGWPLLVYRGASFDPLKQLNGKGVIKPEAYFSPSEEYAGRYGTTRAYFLNIKKPFDVRNAEDADVLRSMLPSGYKFATGESGALDWAEMSSFDVEDLKAMGYDGIVLDEGGDALLHGGVSHRGVSYVPLYGGAQVKSATDNTGAFDPANDDVRFSAAKLAYANEEAPLDEDEHKPDFSVANRKYTWKDYGTLPERVIHATNHIHLTGQDNALTKRMYKQFKVWLEHDRDAARRMAEGMTHSIWANEKYLGHYLLGKYFGSEEGAKLSVRHYFRPGQYFQVNDARLNVGKPIRWLYVHNTDKQNTNMIPKAFAELLADRFGGSVDASIAKKSDQRNTGATMTARLSRNFEWFGMPDKAAAYFIVDDVWTTGSTTVSLLEYLHGLGADVHGIVTIATASNGDHIVPTQDDWGKFLHNAHMTSLKQVAKVIGFDPEKLTGSEVYAYGVKGASGRGGLSKWFEEAFGQFEVPGGLFDAPVNPTFSVAARYNRMSDDDLIVAALAAGMAINPQPGVKGSKNKSAYGFFRKHRKETEKLVMKAHPEIANDYGEVTRLAHLLMMRAQMEARGIVRDAERGVSESEILKRLPKKMEKTYRGELAGQRQTGGHIMGYGMQAKAEIEKRWNDKVTEAVKVQTGVEPDLFEQWAGTDFVETLLRALSNPKEIPVAPKNEQSTEPPDEETRKLEAALEEERAREREQLGIEQMEEPRKFAQYLMGQMEKYWREKKDLGTSPTLRVWSDAVAFQFARKTAQKVFGKIIRSIVYSGAREIALRNIEKFEHATTPYALESMMTYAGEIIHAQHIRETKEQMLKELDTLLKTKLGAMGRFKPDKEELRRKVTAELELRARYMRHAMWLSKESAADEALELQEEADKLIGKYAENEKDVEQSRKYREVQRKTSILREFGALKDKTLAEIEDAVNYWKAAAEDSSAKILQDIRDREIRTVKAADALAAAVVNPKRKNAVEAGVASRINHYLVAHMGFVSMLQDMTRFADGATKRNAEIIIDYIAREVQKAGDRAKWETSQQSNAFVKAVETFYRKPFRKVMDEMNREDERFAPFMGEEGGKRVKPTKARAMQLLVSLLQAKRPGDDYYENAVKHDRHHQAPQIAALLTAQDMNLIGWIGRWYEQNRKGLSDVAEQLFGMGVYSENANYFPVKMKLESQGLEKVEGVGWTIFPKALTPRVRNERDFDTRADILSMWQSRMAEAAQWKAHAKLGLEMRGIFGRSTLQEAIIANHGAKVNKLVQAFITDILTGSAPTQLTESGVEKAADWVRGWTALTALGGNVGVTLKQTTSIPAFGFEIGLKNTAKYIVSAFTPDGMAAMAKLWNSTQRQMRWDSGSSEAVANALRSENASAMKRLFQASMITNKVGDVVPGLVVGQGIYRDCIERGMSEEDAMAETWMIIERTQQSSRIENQPQMQRRVKLGRMMYQFLSTQQQYLQYEIRAAREMVAQPGMATAGRFARTVALNHFVLTSLYFWMGQLYNAMLGQEPPEDQFKDWMIANLLGPFGSLFVLGFVCQATLTRALKGYYNLKQADMLPMEGYIKRQIADGADLVGAIFDETMTWEDALEEGMQWLNDVSPTVRDIRKVDKNYVRPEEYEMAARRRKKMAARRREVKKREKRRSE